MANKEKKNADFGLNPTWALDLLIESASNLPKKESFLKIKTASDPYVKISIPGRLCNCNPKKLRTATIPNESNPEWNRDVII